MGTQHFYEFLDGTGIQSLVAPFASYLQQILHSTSQVGSFTFL
jgi:hypothetical protein